MLGDHSILDPPDSIPNSEVKRNCADGSVGSPHVRVGHRQALNIEKAPTERLGLFSMCDLNLLAVNFLLAQSYAFSCTLVIL